MLLGSMSSILSDIAPPTPRLRASVLMRAPST
jgi:hypothetical protein